MERARERIRVSMLDWTEERGRSATSRQVEERERSERVRGLELEVEAWVCSLARRVSRVLRIAASELRFFLWGLDLVLALSESESEVSVVARRRFFFSGAILERDGGEGGGGGKRGWEFCVPLILGLIFQNETATFVFVVG